VGQVKEVKDHPNADKLYLVTVDLGGESRQLVAGVKNYYKPEELLNKYVAVVTNLQPAVIRGVESAGMILAAQDESGIFVLVTDRPVKPGSMIK